MKIFSIEESKQALRMILSCITSSEGHGLWKLSIVISTCHNWELLTARAHRTLCFTKIRATTATVFLIPNTVVSNPYSHSTAFDLQFFAPLPWVPVPLNRSLSQTAIQILYGFQIGNCIQQCVNSCWIEIF